MTLNKNWFYIIAALILLIVGLSFATASLGEAYEAAKLEAAGHSTRAQAAEAKVKAAEEVKAQLQASNAQLQVDLTRALGRIPKVPPKPNLPTAIPEVQAALQAAGLPVVVQEGVPDTLTPPGARLVLNWQGAAIRVPGLEASLRGTEQALAVCQELNVGLGKELHATELAYEHRGVVVQERTLQVADLTTANRKLELKLSTSTFNNNLKLVVVIPVALYLGYRLGKR